MPARGQRKVDPVKVAELFSVAMNGADVARRLGVSLSVVRRALQSLGIDTSGRNHSEEIKAEAVRLYVDEKLSVPDAAKRLGIKPSGIARHIKKLGLSRSTQEAHALAARGKSSWEVADSRYEIVRMSQLDADSAVVSWTRETPIIEYADGKRYVPDFLIRYEDGTTVLEEVKPSNRVKEEIEVSGKFAAAVSYCEAHGFVFRVVTEHQIGVLTIRNFVMNGLMSPSETERTIRKREVDRAYREKNKARESARQARWYQENRERVLASRNERKKERKAGAAQ